MRFIIETALLQAELLNRTLVIPSFVYARACEYNMYVTLSLLRINALMPLLFRRLQHCLRGLCNYGQ
jgi:hypothetical protein